MNMAFLLLTQAPTLASATSLGRQGTVPESHLEVRCLVEYQMFWVEGIGIVNSVHGIRIKTAPGRGGYVRNVYVSDVSMDNVSIAIRISGNYGDHPDNNYDKNALPTRSNITIKDVVTVNIGVAGLLQGIQGDSFSNICISNVSLGIRSMDPWNCSLVEGYSNSV
jgi:hypothetical protein